MLRVKTNITVASNIYICADSDIRRDPNFVKRVTGRPALQILKDNYTGTLNGVKLSPWQESMYEESAGCSNAHNGEMPYGLVRKDGELKWEGRCEYRECSIFNLCKGAAHFARNTVQPAQVIEQPPTPLTYEWLGETDELFKPQEENADQSANEIIPDNAIITNIKAFVAEDEYEKIDSPATIIEAEIDSKILVNAAPGSGKTYTVIHRIEYIVRNCLVDDFSEVLVLVYTKAAEKEILVQLQDGIADGSLPYSASTVDIATFDSFATSYLSAISAKFKNRDYNSRIKLFNELFNQSDFSNFKYVIVDELQDLVNERAKMTLNILSALTGGYLLLGDKCQAIYDYDCHNSDNVSSIHFYKRLNALLPQDVSKYELCGNRRQNECLAAISDNLRRALLNFDSPNANEHVADELNQIKTLGNVDQFDFSNIKKSTAILCRNNGEAEYISHILHKKGCPHTLLRNNAQPATLKRFIADCLWDYHSDPRITRVGFVERFCARVLDDNSVASLAFDTLCNVIYDEKKDAIEIEELAHALSRQAANIPDFILNTDNPLLTVSTIHKSKGREFDTVFLLDNKFSPSKDNTEEARVWYVGCTRAKSELCKLNKLKSTLKRSLSNNQRWIETRQNRGGWTNNRANNRSDNSRHCCGIVLGLPMDFSDSGFVNGDFLSALAIQQYIATIIKINDTVKIKLIGGQYKALHNENTIGYLNQNMTKQLREIARESNGNSGAPTELSPLFVSNIITVTPPKFPGDVAPYFRQSKFWLGVELTGFPKIIWK